MDLSERLPLIVKCDMCEDRLDEGLEPACAATCISGAITFGLREDMLELAHQRLEENPDLCREIYGEHENGGTSTFYITPKSFNKTCLASVDTHSTAYSNRQVTHTTPTVAGVAALALSGVYLALEHFGKGEEPQDNDPETGEEK